jgi:ParB-like chromosome segregation protein Spo0J
MRYSPRKVAMAELDLEWDRYSCSFPRQVPALEDSLRRMGLIEPVLLIPSAEGYRVVSGYRRASAARNLGWRNIDARILELDEPDDSSLFLIGLEENLSVRTLNLIERAIAVTRLKDDPGLDPNDPKRAFYLERLGIRDRDREISRSVRLAGLDEDIQSFIVEKGLAENHADPLLILAEADAKRLAAAALRYRLTASQVKELAESAREIASRDGIPVPGVLEGIESRVDQGEENPARRRNAYMGALRAKRLPDYSRIKGDIEICLSAINGRKGITVAPPPYLEGGTFLANLTFEDPAALEEAARALLAFSQSPALARAVELLNR